MAEHQSGEAKCMCGAVTVKAAKIDRHAGACHCGMCRKWSGGPLLAVDCGKDVLFEGDDNITVYSSSNWADRGFCSHCGTHLFYRLKASGQYIMPAGLFEKLDYDFDHQIFIDRKPGWYAFENDTKDMTEAEVFAKYAPGGE